jgi:hypothetical protein
MDGWCDADEIEIDLATVVCLTFEEVDYDTYRINPVADDDELEWDDDESIFEEDLDESLYGVDDDEEEGEEEGLVVEDDEWP